MIVCWHETRTQTKVDEEIRGAARRSNRREGTRRKTVARGTESHCQESRTGAMVAKCSKNGLKNGHFGDLIY